jgi:ribonuclease P protein component
MRRELRLRNRKAFAAVYRRGRPYRGELLVIRTLRTDGGPTRFGFAVGRRVGGAVVRNRTKRRLREAARSLEVRPGWDVVVGARAAAAMAKYDLLRQALADLLRRAGLLAQGESIPSSSEQP